MCVCVCVSVCMARLGSSRLKHISVGNNCTSLAQPSEPITNDGSQNPPGSTPIAETRVWLVGYKCVCALCLYVCLETVEKESHGQFHLRRPHGWRGGDAVSAVMRVTCR